MQNMLNSTLAGVAANVPTEKFWQHEPLTMWIPTLHRVDGVDVTTVLGGATVTLEVTSDGENYEPYTDSEGTVAQLAEVGKFLYVFVASPMLFRFRVSGATGSTLIPAIIFN